MPPGESGCIATGKILTVFLKLKILILTMLTMRSICSMCWRNGAKDT